MVHLDSQHLNLSIQANLFPAFSVPLGHTLRYFNLENVDSVHVRVFTFCWYVMPAIFLHVL